MAAFSSDGLESLIEISDSDSDEKPSLNVHGDIRIVKKLPEIISILDYKRGVGTIESTTRVLPPDDSPDTTEFAMSMADGCETELMLHHLEEPLESPTQTDDQFSYVRSLFDVESDDESQATDSGTGHTPSGSPLLKDVPITIVFKKNSQVSSKEKSEFISVPMRMVPSLRSISPTDEEEVEESRRKTHQIMERRRRHDMSYRFQLLQSLLYPNAEKMSKHFVLNAAAKTIGSLNSQHKRLTQEHEAEKAKREKVVAKLKALRASQKNKYTAITVNEETGSRVAISDPILEQVMEDTLNIIHQDPCPNRPSDVIPHIQIPAPRIDPPAPKVSNGPKSASELLFRKQAEAKIAAGNRKPIVARKSPSASSGAGASPLLGASSSAAASPLLGASSSAAASPLLGAIAKDAARSLLAHSSGVTASKSPKQTNVTVVRSMPKAVSLEQLEKKELVLSKCENCGERVAFSSQVLTDINCPRCHHRILKCSESNHSQPHCKGPQKTSASSDMKLERSSVKMEATVEISDCSDSDGSDKVIVSSGDVLDILKDGVKGYVDNVGEDEVIVVIKDEKSGKSTLSLVDSHSGGDTVDGGCNSESASPDNRRNVRKKLGF